METSGESSTADVLDHYASYDSMAGTSSSGNRSGMIPHLRANSNLSTRSGTSSHNSHHQALINAGLARPAGAEGAFGDDHSKPYSPINTPSLKSSSSSLRHSVAMLKSGVFPPGLSMRRARRDSTDSDGSHYDDEEDHGYDMERGGPFESRPASATASYEQHLSDPHADGSDSHHFSLHERSNSGKKPIKRHSAHQQTPMQGKYAELEADTSGWEKTPLQKVIGLGVDDNIQTPKIGSDKPISPTKRFASESERRKDEAKLIQSPTDENEEEREMQRQQSLSSETDDPNRPRTLKEARALAKERAKMRAQAKDSGAPTSETIQSSTARPEKKERRPSLISNPSASSNFSQESEGQTRVATAKGDSDQPQRQSRQLASPKAANLDLIAIRRYSESTYNIPSPKSANAMEALQNAIGEAIEDVSFVSTATSGTNTDTYTGTIPVTRAANTLEPPSAARIAGDLDNESSAPSVASFDSAKESQTISRPHSTVVNSRGELGWTKENEKDSSDTALHTKLTQTSLDDKVTADSPASIPLVASTSGPFTLASNIDRGLHQAQEARFRPHSMQPQQRSTAPNKIARLDIYGKTIPWPAAFSPEPIIEQRRLAPWERARGYAHYCNDLSKISTGLEIWIDMVQRPSQRVAAAPDPITPQNQHKRGQGTDHSGYAMSVRSDATFPMRGDGGRAKEIQQSMPAMMEESPPGNLPSNLPYPSLAQQTSNTSTSFTSSTSDMGSSQSSDRDRTGRPSNFFSNLGRAKSTRRTPGTGSFTSLGPLISNVTSSTGPPTRGPVRAKGMSISNPIGMSSSPSITLGKTSTGTELTSLQEAGQSSPSPQGAIARGHMPSSSSSSLTSQGGNRAPMGPRAPSSGTLPLINQPESRRDSVLSIPTGHEKNPPSVVKDQSSASNVSDYQSASPLMNVVKSSLSYGSVRDKRSPLLGGAILQPPTSNASHRSSGDYTGKRSSSINSNSRRGSQIVTMKPASAAENEALDKLADVLPDAERSILLEHLRKAGGNDLIAIGDYLQAQSRSEGKHLLR